MSLWAVLNISHKKMKTLWKFIVPRLLSKCIYNFSTKSVDWKFQYIDYSIIEVYEETFAIGKENLSLFNLIPPDENKTKCESLLWDHLPIFPCFLVLNGWDVWIY